MTASTTTAAGQVLRYHRSDLSECADPACNLAHAMKAELDTFDDEAIAFRAGAMCAASEPHGVIDSDWPCPSCLARIRTASAPASTVTGGPAAVGAVDGAAGRVPRPSSAAPPSVENNRARDITPDPAEGATAIAQKQV